MKYLSFILIVLGMVSLNACTSMDSYQKPARSDAALYPQSQDTHMAILIKLSTGEWTNDLQSSFAKQSPALTMLDALKGFYGEEIERTILPS